MAANLRTNLALDALVMALFARGDTVSGLVHHSDRGVQYLTIKYSECLAEVGAVGAVGSRGDSYDNALAETVNGLYKAEFIYRAGPWRSVDQVELATATGPTSASAAVATAPVATWHRQSSRRPTISPYRRPPRPLETQSAESPRNPGRLS